MPSPSTIFLYTAVAGVVIIYYLLSHLRRRKLPPGPTPWPIIGNLPQLGAMPHHAMADMARKHGPLLYLRFGSNNVVVAASAEVAEQIYKAHDVNFSSRPPNSAGKHITYNYEDLVFRPYGPRWRMLRKICTVHLFSNKALDDFRRVREEEVALLTQALVSARDSPINLGQLLHLCTTNALGRMVLGKRVFGDGTGRSDPEADEFKSMNVEILRLSGVFNIGDFIPSLDWLDLQGVVRDMKKLHDRFDRFLDKILQDHKRSSSNGLHKHEDLLTQLLSQDAGDGTKLSDIEIKALLLNLFIAGTDTSSSTVEWTMAELVRHPKLLARAKAELDNVVGSDRLVSEADLPQLNFIQAITKETLRLHPPTPLSLPRVAAESCEINGYIIPKDTALFTHIWAIGRDPKVWADPLEFRPERFLPGGEKADSDVKGNDFDVIPFGAGRRICVGMSLGLRVLNLLTATLVHGFDWELGKGESAETLNMEEAFGQTLQRAKPLMVKPLPRLARQVYGLSH